MPLSGQAHRQRLSGWNVKWNGHLLQFDEILRKIKDKMGLHLIFGLNTVNFIQDTLW